MFKTFFVLLLNEMRTLLRARISLFWVFVFPFFFLVMMLLSYGGQGALGSATIRIVDLDKSELSSSYIQDVRQVFSSGDPIAGTVVLDTKPGNIGSDAVRVTIPAGFEKSIKMAAPVSVVLEYDFAGGMSTQVASKVFRSLTVRYNARVTKSPMPVSVEARNSGMSKAMDFSFYMLTGILVMSMMTAGMNSTCIAIADMRERNTFKFMSMLPMRPLTYLAALLMARLFMIFIAAYTLLFGARYIFGIVVPLDAHRLFNTSIVLAIGGGMLIAAGLALSSRLRTASTAVFICNLVYLTLLFASDLTMPLGSISSGARKILSALPVSQFVVTLRAALINGVDLMALSQPILSMMTWGLFFIVVARLLFFWHKG